MGEKGNSIVIEPSVLIPAVTINRMSNAEMESHCATLRASAQEALNSGWWQGERLKGQAECANAVVEGCQNLAELFKDLAAATGTIYDKYLTAETRAGIDAQVSSTLEKLAAKGSKGALRKK